MRVWLDADKLAARGLTAGDVESALRAENVELGAGRLESSDRDFILRVARDYTTPEAFAAAREALSVAVTIGDRAPATRPLVVDRIG